MDDEKNIAFSLVYGTEKERFDYLVDNIDEPKEVISCLKLLGEEPFGNCDCVMPGANKNKEWIAYSERARDRAFKIFIHDAELNFKN